MLKTQQVVHRCGTRCGDIELAVYLTDAAGPINLVLDMRIAHESWMSSSSPVLNGNLPYPAPTDIDKKLNKAAVDKIRDYRADYNNRPSNSVSFMPGVANLLHSEIG